MQSESVEQVSRSVVDMEPLDAEIDPPVPFMPPAARLPPAPTAPGEPPPGACSPKGVREQAKRMGMSKARRFISVSFPRGLREHSQATRNDTTSLLAMQAAWGKSVAQRM
jgi:hypothetical protein